MMVPMGCSPRQPNPLVLFLFTQAIHNPALTQLDKAANPANKAMVHNPHPCGRLNNSRK